MRVDRAASKNRLSFEALFWAESKPLIIFREKFES